jgi:hypothetical protein
MPMRYLCDVLEEMRKCYKTRNFASLLGLIEEAQTLGNRMEAGLGERKSYQTWHNKVKREKEEYRKLLEETNKLRKKAGKPKKAFSKYDD